MKSLKILFLASLLMFFIGCGARKVDMHKTYEKEHTEAKITENKQNDIEQKTDVKKQENTDSKTNTDASSTQKTVDEEFTLIVEPTAENPLGEYNVNINGKVITGKTNAKITITNKKKTDSIHKQVKIDETKNVKKNIDSVGTKIDKSKSDLKIETESDKVKKEKDKTTDKKEPWALNILGIAVGIGLIVAIYFIVKSYIKKYSLKG